MKKQRNTITKKLEVILEFVSIYSSEGYYYFDFPDEEKYAFKTIRGKNLKQLIDIVFLEIINN